MLGGFLVLWLSFAFLVNKAPEWTRLLIMLRSSRTVVEALRWATTAGGRSRCAPQLIDRYVVVAVVAADVSAGWDYVQSDGTGRRDRLDGPFAHAHENVPGQKFYVVSSATQPYYARGNLGPENEWLARFMRANLVQFRSTPRPKDFLPLRRSRSSCGVRSGSRSPPSSPSP